MKLLSLITTLCCLPLSALPLGNPWDSGFLYSGPGVVSDSTVIPGLVRCHPLDFVRMGFYGDYVFNRHLQNNSIQSIKTLHRVQLNTNAAFIGFNFCKGLELFTTFGASRIFIETPSASFFVTNITSHPLTLFTETDFSWSLGARGTLWRYGAFALGAEAQYFYTNPDISSIFVHTIEFTYYPAKGTDFKYQEWQIGMGATYQICLGQGFEFFPYTGLTWSAPRVNIGGGGTLPIGGSTVVGIFDHLERQRLCGYALGFTLLACDRLTLDVEGRFASETALHFELEARF